MNIHISTPLHEHSYNMNGQYTYEQTNVFDITLSKIQRCFQKKIPICKRTHYMCVYTHECVCNYACTHVPAQWLHVCKFMHMNFYALSFDICVYAWIYAYVPGAVHMCTYSQILTRVWSALCSPPICICVYANINICVCMSHGCPVPYRQMHPYKNVMCYFIPPGFLRTI